MEKTSSSSKLPLIVAVSLAAVVFFLSYESYFSTFAERYLQDAVRAIQIYSLVIYGLIVYRFSQDNDLIRTFDSQQEFSSFLGDLGGPLFSLAAEYVQIFISLRISRLFLEGITLNEWEHGLTGLDFWLVLGITLLIAVYGLITIVNRSRQLMHYWGGDIAEVIPN